MESAATSVKMTRLLSFAEQWTIAVATISAEFGEMDVLPDNAGDHENPPIP